MWSAFNSARCGAAENCAVKQGGVSEPSSEEDNASLHSISIILITQLQLDPSGMSGKSWAFFFLFFFLKSLQENVIFTHGSNGWRANPVMNAHRETRDWYLDFRGSFYYCACVCRRLNFSSPSEARWEGRGVEGGWLNMAEPMGHQGALAGPPQSAWIPVEFIVWGWQVTRGR